MGYIGLAGLFIALGIWWGLGSIGEGLHEIAEAMKAEDQDYDRP